MGRATQGVLAVAVLVSACGRRSDPPAPAPAPSATVITAESAITGIAEPDRSSSALALATRRDGTRVLLLADEDDATLRALTTDGKEIASVKLAGTPGHVVVEPSGTIWVAGRDTSEVQSFRLTCASSCALTLDRSIAVSAEPIALALHGGSLYVASAWARELARVRLSDGMITARTAIGKEPRAILASDTTIAIAHASGSILGEVTSTPTSLTVREHRLDYRDHIFDPGGWGPVADEPRFAGQGYALARVDSETLAPMTLAYPGDPSPSPSYGSARDDGFFPAETAVVTLVNGAPKIRSRASVFEPTKNRISMGRVEWPKETPPCLLPRAAIADRARGSILVACMGIDAIVELDAKDKPLLESQRGRWRVPSGPIAIALDAEHRDAWVWSMLDRKIARIALLAAGDTSTGAREPASSFAVAPATELEASWAEGRKLFHTPVGFDGRACASCHPDARSDGLTWASPKGPLQTPILAGRLEKTAPYGWLGEGVTLEGHLGETAARLRAKPFDDATKKNLATYIAGAKTFATRHTPTDLEARGRAIFESTETGCVTCHLDGGLVGDGSRRDVGTGGAFDTPSLRFVGTSAPYLHDGRYQTLREVLANTEGKMGTTKQLREPDMLALLAYLRSI